MLVARNALRNAVFGCQRATVPHLSPLSSACSCTSTSCRSSSHCVSWLSESSTSVLSANVLRRNTLFRLVPQRVACHQDIVVSFRLLSKLWRTPPVPTWSCCPVSLGPKETARTTRLVLTSSILRGDCPRSGVYRLHSSTSRSARPGTRHHSSRTYAPRPVASRPPKPSISTRWITCEQSHQMHC